MTSQEIDAAEDIIVCQDVHKWFGDFHVLRGVTTTVKKGEVVVVFGPSGSGKSTFIRVINRLEEHQRGQITVRGIELTHDIRNIEAVRREVGMVFQSLNVFPHLTVLQNITLAPIRVRKWSRREAERVAMGLLERVGIPEQSGKYPAELSGGQQQRVAIARALVNEPQVLIADEPTGNLDHQRSEEIMELLNHANSRGTTIIVATHDKSLLKLGNKRIIHLDKGRLIN